MRRRGVTRSPRLRKLALPFVALLLAGIGAFAPVAAPVAQAAGGPKVAVIVGATHGATAEYRDYGNEIAATAAKYTSNVVKVFSPHATWSKVKAAVNGASIVVYLGHGNGWPTRTRTTRTTRRRTASGSTTTSTATASSPTTRTSTTASRRSGR